MPNQLPETCDVAIIGGGPAGSTAATLLARRGLSVCVLEKERFPRFHVGESLLPYNSRIFEELGVQSEITAAGFVTKRGAQFHVGDGSRCTKFRFRDGSFTEFPTALQVERSRFDEILLRNAERNGASVFQETAVTGFNVESQHVALTLRQNGSDASLRSRFLIDASGVVNFTGTREKLREDHPTLRKVAVFGHFENVCMPAGDEQGDIVIVRMKNAWCWMIPLSDRKTSIGLVFDKTEFRNTKPAALFEATVQAHEVLRTRLSNARLIGELHTIADFSYVNRRLVSDRLVRVGDAAAFLDPIFSSGVYLAMIGAKAGSDAVADALQSDATMTSTMRSYEARCLTNMKIYREMIERFYTPDLMEVLMSPRDFFKVPEAVNAILAGRLDGCFSVRWRLRLFYLLVGIQRRLPFLPRIGSLR